MAQYRDYVGTLHVNVEQLGRRLQDFMDATYGRPLTAEQWLSNLKGASASDIQQIEATILELAAQVRTATEAINALDTATK